MKIKILFSTLFLIAFMLNISFGQNAYYYTLKLKKIKEDKKTTPLLDNFINNQFDKSKSDIQSVKNEIDKIYSSIIENEKNNKSTSANESKLEDLLKKVPLNTQSVIIDALSKYTAERFKDEVTTLYIDKFRTTLKKEPYKEFEFLIPETYNYLNTANFFDYKEISTTLKQQFEEDLDNGLIGTKKYLDLSVATKKFRENNTDSYHAVSFSLDLGQQLKDKKPFSDVINYLDLTYKGEVAYTNYYNIIHTINLLQENMRKAEFGIIRFNSKNYWLKSSDWLKFDENMDWIYFSAFMYYEDPDFFNKLTQKIPISKTITSNDALIIKNYISKVANILQSIDVIQSSSPEIKAESYVTMFSHLLALIELVNNENLFIDKRFVEMSKYSVDIAKTILQKKYSNTVSEGIKLLNEILDGNSDKDKIVSYFVKYTTFMVDVTTAKDSEELKEVIKKNVTSYSYLDKRKSKVSLTLNADPGIIPFTSYEWLDKFSNGKSVFAVTCPIGIDIVGSGKENYTGISLNILDIAAAFSYRLNDSESELPEKLSFKQVFSPGGAIKGGFKNTPISWAVGYQYTPSLRGIKDDKIENVKNASRVFFRFTWDLPLVKFYSKDSK